MGLPHYAMTARPPGRNKLILPVLPDNLEDGYYYYTKLEGKEMKRTKIVALLTLTVFLLTLVPAAAFAGGQVKVTVKVEMEFKDVNSAKWALKQISELKAKDIIAGYRDGTFQPNKPVTRAEAVAMVLKATGLAEEANRKVSESVYGTVGLPFKDAKSIPNWAKGFLTVAVEKGYLTEDQVGNFQPNKPATRIWVAKLLVRALKVADDVYAAGNVELPFNDAAAIPAGDAVFIAAAMENGLLKGYPDGTFKPNKPVTRAEMAVLLGIADDEVPLPEVRRHKIVGTVVSVQEGTVTTADVTATENTSPTDNVAGDVYETEPAPAPTPAPVTGTTITIKKLDDTEATYPVAPEVKVFIEDQAAALADVIPGLRVELVLNKDKTVVYIESKAEIYRGRLTVYDAAYGSMTIKTREAEQTFTVAENVQVTINDKPAALADLKAGMKAGIKVADGKVVLIKAVAFKERVKERAGGKPGAKEKVRDNTRDQAKDKAGQRQRQR